MDVPASSARSQTSARSRISTTVVITLSGISLVASHRVETDARVASVSVSAITTVKCVQTLPPIRHNSEGCGWKKRKRRSGEEEDKKKMKKEKETAQTTDFFHLCQQSCLPRYFPIVVCIHIIVLYISCLSRNRDQSIFDFGLVQCFIFVWCILGSVFRDYTPSCRKRASKCVGDFVKTFVVQQNFIQQN